MPSEPAAAPTAAAKPAAAVAVAAAHAGDGIVQRMAHLDAELRARLAARERHGGGARAGPVEGGGDLSFEQRRKLSALLGELTGDELDEVRTC
jgi:hypothetical protein